MPSAFSNFRELDLGLYARQLVTYLTGQIAFHHPTAFGCTLALCLAKFPALTLARARNQFPVINFHTFL